MNTLNIVKPNWAVPAHVKAFSTTRIGGVSKAAFNSNNLALHVDDNVSDVLKNRELLRVNGGLPSEPFWLNQTHTTKVVDVTGDETNADASFSKTKGAVCIVMTADCLPILLCDKQGKQVAAIHAGWRGLLNGIIENTLDQFLSKNEDIVAWLGPAIGPTAFEVGAEVKDLFVARDADASSAFAFLKEQRGIDKWLMNIYQLASMRLKKQGVKSITGGEYCTFSDESLFYSYRRDNVCGRMATLVWLDK